MGEAWRANGRREGGREGGREGRDEGMRERGIEGRCDTCIHIHLTCHGDAVELDSNWDRTEQRC